MGQRLQLQTLLENLLGSRNVYFQPPENVKMNFPCIVYKRNAEKANFADDNLYGRQVQYALTVIDPNPDSIILDKVANLPMCKFVTHFTKDNLNHDIYNLYY